ncbi:2-keto-4-pentenoate hydratase [Enterovirga aerilata]|uniref:Hydratase n=1 Tax=Enterovirga aerilata TaxID=2730920 RepID=A0A849I6G7_9HYPH|nr:hydratase [Enterovirga sp. DB1703]NNM71999.1 hydratase [Enterovirga sp. DB1703]
MRVPMVAMALVATLPAAAQAACPSDQEVARFTSEWLGKQPAKGMPVETMEDAACARDKVVAALEKSGGKVVGYKAALTAKAVQERFKASAPVAGVLLDTMILPDGATVPASYGARPVFEADMLLVVKDEGINDARSPEEAIRHISAMRPFIELPDLVLAPGEKLEGVQLLAINAGARLGVAGAEVPLQPTPETVKLLAETKIVLADASGQTIAEGTGSATLGNPLNSVIWLATDLAKVGRKLKAGDLVSVGSFSPLTPPKPGQTVSVRYDGFPGTPKVSVTFN